MDLITSSDLPQADRLESVIATVIAVQNGARTDIEIANQIEGIEGDDRQGRYYRNAAELLGFISNYRNNATILNRGSVLLEDPNIENPLLIRSVLELNVFQKLIPILENSSENISRNQIKNYLASISVDQLSENMINRRLSTLTSWLKSLNFLIENSNREYTFVNSFNSEIPFLEISDIDQPLLPIVGDLSEFQRIAERSNRARNEITYLRDQAALERANNVHSRLVNMVAERIRLRNAIPRSNQLVDLAVNIEFDFLFEMKSTTDINARSQVRKGVSQLYEYRYLQSLPEANLVLVIDNNLSDDNNWMIDYLEVDRNISLIWDGRDELFGTERTREKLGFLDLQPFS